MDNECSICKQNIGITNNCTTECNHKYCLKCLLHHIKINNTCPLCRVILVEREFDDDTDSSEEVRSHNIIEINTYEFHGRISLNNNLKILFTTIIVSIHLNLLYVLLLRGIFINN